ncbi:MAG: four helix bundle protein [Candidatus Pacebacteria bacterium]|nr:four helix bundle protein [Candidatus Paceibacterota bacterium]
MSDKRFNPEERTAVFGANVISLCKTVKADVVSKPIINQLVRSATSIGANYCEANGASSRKDFRNKIHICQKEAKESKHWLRMLSECVPEKKDIIRALWQECYELTLIFGRVTSTLNNKTET